MEEVKNIIITWFKELIPYLIIIVIVLLVRKFIVTPVRVNGSSMEPTLINKELLILERLNKNYERFDVVVLNYKGEKLVKRVVGLPYENIKYYNNKLYVNDEIIDEPISLDTKNYYLEDYGFSQIPEGYYFVMGDNRDNSVDSRWIGLINKNQIEGTVRFRFFPFNKIGVIK